MALTELKLKNLKAEKTSKRYLDKDGLYIVITPNNKRTFYFRFKVYLDEKRVDRMYQIGEYPRMTLAQARAKHRRLATEVDSGIDVFTRDKVDIKKIKPKKKKPTLREIADKYFELRQKQVEESTYGKEKGRYLNYLDMTFGDKQIEDITRSELLAHCTEIAEDVGRETGKRVLSVFRCINEYAEDLQITDINIATNLIKRMPKVKSKRRNALVDKEWLGKFMYCAEVDSPDEITLYARLIAHLGLRPGELQNLKWNEIDWKKKEINFYCKKIKSDWRVHLSDEVIAILQKLRDLTGGKENLFYSYGKSRVISVKSVQDRMHIWGFPRSMVVPHGFRATMQTIGIDEDIGTFEVIDLCLTHKPMGALRDIYNRATRWKDRVKFYNDWSKFLVKMRKDYQKSKIKVVQ